MPPAPHHVVFVHGLFMPGGESRWFRQRLSAAGGAGWSASVFAYRTTREPLGTVLDRLEAHLNDRPAEQLHLVGHSLGGIVTLRMLQRLQARGEDWRLPPGRVVLLGSPVCGSRAAARLETLPLGRALLGQLAIEGLLRQPCREGSQEPLCDWQPSRDVGVIAGTNPVGLGRVLARFNEPNDGTVALRETDYPAARDRVVLPVSHMGMLLSVRVAEETAHFLRDGRFSLRSD
jgi:pimeloyl-ACP methyl ester carboxylesterase